MEGFQLVPSKAVTTGTAWVAEHLKRCKWQQGTTFYLSFILSHLSVNSHLNAAHEVRETSAGEKDEKKMLGFEGILRAENWGFRDAN